MLRLLRRPRLRLHIEFVAELVVPLFFALIAGTFFYDGFMHHDRTTVAIGSVLFMVGIIVLVVCQLQRFGGELTRAIAQAATAVQDRPIEITVPGIGVVLGVPEDDDDAHPGNMPQ